MTENTVLIEGKEFVSADRAAKLVGYTKDYVGQLARAGKIEAKRIGRSWYISQNSITKHKLSVHYTLTKPKKPVQKESDDSENVSLHVEESQMVDELNARDTSNINSISGNDSHEDSEEYDLLPRLIEKKRDVLLNTDIRYEEDIPASPSKNDDIKQNSNNQHVKTVPIRTPEKKILRSKPSFSNGERRSNAMYKSREVVSRLDGVRIDGIHVPGDGRRVRMGSGEQQFSNSTQLSVRNKKRIVRTPPAREYEIDTEYEKDQDDNSSKVIPVVGAIIVFTIFVVIYIFVFS